jgi:hypothetical protein
LRFCMSRKGHEKDTPDQEGLSEERLRQLTSYGVSEEAAAFDRRGTVIPRDSDDRLRNRYLTQQPTPAPAPQSAATQQLRTEVPSFDSMLEENSGQNGHSVMPTEAVNGFIPAEEPEAGHNQVWALRFEATKAAVGGLKASLKERASAVSQKVVNALETSSSGLAVIRMETTEKAGESADQTWASIKERSSNLKASVQEKVTRERLIAAGAVLGAVAVAALVEQKFAPGLHGSQHASEITNSATPSHPKAAHHITGIEHAQAIKVQASHNLHKAAKAAHHVHRHLKFYVEHIKYHGDTVWFHAQSKLQTVLGHKPSANQLNEYVRRTLKFNHMNWDSAREVVRGQTIKLPLIHR